MEIFLYVLVVALVFVTGGLLWVIISERSWRKEKPDTNFLLLQNQMNELSRTLDTRLNESAKMLTSQFSSSVKIVQDITEKLGKLDETNKQVVNFADQLKGLQDILKNPKQRGVLGEYYLKTVLENVMPPGQFQMQYEFKDGTIVDAVIFLSDKVIPIDSKFSLENYNRMLEASGAEERKRFENAFREDLKQRIEETSKYVKPEEGTMDFAFMFIPSEAVYYDLLVNKVGAVKSTTSDLIEYAARDKRVIVVSPTTFFAYLQSVLQGLRALSVEKSAQEILKRVQQLGKHLIGVDSYIKKLGIHLGTTVNAYNSAYRELGKVDKDIEKISGESAKISPILIEKPQEAKEETS